MRLPAALARLAFDIGALIVAKMTASWAFGSCSACAGNGWRNWSSPARRWKT
jgi:hypothetical protein